MTDEYLSTEHLLLAMLDATGGQTAAGRLLAEAGVTRDAVLAGAGRRCAAASASPTRTPRRSTRRSSGTAATSPSWRAQGKLDPVIGRDDEIRRTIQVLSPPHEEQPGADRRARRRQDRDRRGARPAHRRRRRPRGR